MKKTTISLKTLFLTGVSLGAWAGAAPVLAQTPAEESLAQASGIPEIVVTARRQEESLLEVPLSVTAFTEAAIEDAGFQDFNDVTDLSPGVFNSSVVGRSNDRPTIRGFSQVSTTGGANAGVFIDGIFVSGSVSALELDNLERVEIVKGPQSTQFGRGTLAGAINYVTRKPGDTWESRLKITGAQHSEFDVSAFMSGPITERIGAAISGRYYTRGSEFTNAFTGNQDIGGEESASLTGTFTLQATESLDFVLRASWAESEDEQIAFYTQGPEFNNCNLNTPRRYYCGVIDVDEDNIRLITEDGNYLDGFSGNDRDSFRLALTSTWEDGPHMVQLLSSYQEQQRRTGFDASRRAIQPSVFLPSGTAIDITTEWEDYAQELRYSGDFDALQVTLGGYYFKSERGEVATYIPDDRGIRTAENLAVFAGLEYAVTDSLTVKGEFRYQDDTAELDDPDSNVFIEASFDAFLPRVTVEYDVTDQVMVYGVYAKGNKPGSFNTANGLPLDLIPIDEEETDMFELGAKGRVLDDRLQYELAAFYYDWSGQQLTEQCGPPTCPRTITYTDNTGSSEIMGFETTFTAIVMPDFWSARATVAYVDSEIQEFEVVGAGSVLAEARGFGFPDIVTENGTNAVLVSGTPAPASPKWTASLTNTFTGPVTDEIDWVVRSDLIYVGTQYASIFGQAETGDRFNANLRVGVESDQWEITAWVKNLTDDDTALAALRTIRFDSPLPPPAAFGIGIQRAFGTVVQPGRQFGGTLIYRF